MGVPVLARLPMARSVYFKGSENDQVWGELLDRSWRLTPEASQEAINTAALALGARLGRP